MVALLGSTCLLLAGCGGSSDGPPESSASRTPAPAPDVELTQADKQAWAKLPPDRAAIPVLLYHGVGPESDFANAADAEYGVDADDFAKQMTLMHHAGYRTIDLQTFIDFVRKKPVDLPPDRCCSPSTTREPTPGPVPTGSSLSWASRRSCSSTWAAWTPGTPST